MRWSTPVLAGVAGVASLAMVGAGGVAVVQHNQAEQAEQRAEQAEARAEELSQRVEELERRIEEEGGDPDAAGDGSGEGGLGGLGDLGDMGDLGGLLDGLTGGDAGEIAGAECLAPGGGGLDSLLGGEGGLEDLMDQFLGGEGGEAEQQPDPEALVEQVASQVSEARGLEWTEPPQVEFLDEDQMRQRLQEIIQEDYTAEDAELEGRTLQALGAVPRDADMQQLRGQLFEEQVAGFYDPESGELVVRTPGGQIGPVDQATLAHELDHALTDQAIGLPDLAGEEFTEDEDAALGALSVVEGDATLLMNHWMLEHVSLVDQLALAGDPSMLAAQESMDQLPPYLGAELMFPYLAGMDYVCHHWQDGEWAAVDELYEDVPRTSAEVLWPQEHPGRVAEPAAVSAPSGYEQAHTTTFGAAPLLWLLEAPGGDTEQSVADAEAKVRAWGGGQLTLWTSGDDTALGLSLVDRGGQAPLCDTVNEWYAASFPGAQREDAGEGTTRFDGEAQDAVVSCDGDDVLVGIGPDLDVAEQVVS